MGYWIAEPRDRVLWVRFARPPRNFMSFAAMEDLHAHLEAVASDPAGKVCGFNRDSVTQQAPDRPG